MRATSSDGRLFDFRAERSLRPAFRGVCVPSGAIPRFVTGQFEVCPAGWPARSVILRAAAPTPASVLAAGARVRRIAMRRAEWTGGPLVPWEVRA